MGEELYHHLHSPILRPPQPSFRVMTPPRQTCAPNCGVLHTWAGGLKRKAGKQGDPRVEFASPPGLAAQCGIV